MWWLLLLGGGAVTTTMSFSLSSSSSSSSLHAPPPMTTTSTTTMTTTTLTGRRRPGKRMSSSSSSLQMSTTVERPTVVEEKVKTAAVEETTTTKTTANGLKFFDGEKERDTLDVRIDGTWYDLSRWRKSHPAGTHWIDWYNGRDATEVMDAFHSEKGRRMVTRLPRTKDDIARELENSAPKETSTMLAFRKLRQQLENQGWFKRDTKREVTLLSIWTGCVVGGAVFSRTIPPLGIFLTALAMTQAGWLGHDYVHGVDKWCDRFRQLTTIGGGLGCTWWSDKHNKHHALTNEQGVDEDIATDPFLYTWAPDPKHDSPLRRIQHWIFFIPFSFLFALWRVDTIKVILEAYKEKRKGSKNELYGLILHYAILLIGWPLKCSVPAVFLSGLMSALIVTPTHQSESLFEEYQHDWVTAQFMSTRNAVMSNPYSEWLWGGMQYQLEHHLFPAMPRGNYPKLRPILQKFARDNNIPGGYRESGEFEILYMNWKLYRQVAKADPVVGAPYSRGHGQLGAICMGFSPAAKMARG